VMLEAMACGTPVAAFPVDGPMEVLGVHSAQPPRGGVLHDSLLVAAQEALAVARSEARSRALEFTWAEAAKLFQLHLVPAHSGAKVCVTVTNTVTSLSSER